MAKKKKQDAIETNEHYSFTKKFTPKELAQKEQEFSKLITDNWKLEQELKKEIEERKRVIAENQSAIKRLSHDVEKGGEDMWEDCAVTIDFEKDEKRYYFEGVLVGTEEIEESDRQLSID